MTFTMHLEEIILLKSE